MIDFMIQALSLTALLVGILSGEFVAFRAFGRPRRAAVLLDIAIFVLLLSGVYYYLGFYAADMLFYAANFFVGLVTIVLARALEAALGLTETVRSAQHIAARLVPALVKAGMDADEIGQWLRSIGVSGKQLKALLDKVEREIPPYLPKIVRIYDELDEIRAQLAALTAALAPRAHPKRAAQARTAASRQRPAERDRLGSFRRIIEAAIQRAEQETAQPQSAMPFGEASGGVPAAPQAQPQPAASQPIPQPKRLRKLAKRKHAKRAKRRSAKRKRPARRLARKAPRSPAKRAARRPRGKRRRR